MIDLDGTLSRHSRLCAAPRRRCLMEKKVAFDYQQLEDLIVQQIRCNGNAPFLSLSLSRLISNSKNNAFLFLLY